MRRSAASCLLAIVALAAVLRLSPLTRFLYFGSDFGEYFRISQGLVATGHIFLPYDGWGVTYPYFPGMFFPAAGAAFGGLEVAASLSLYVPILGAVVVAIVFLITGSVFRDDRSALVAAAFLAVAMPHAFFTAHPIPAVVGELLAAMALLLYLRLPRDSRTWALLLPLTGALVMTHHLAAYFLFVMALAASALAWLIGARSPSRSQVSYLAVLSAFMVAYWFGYAEAFRASILIDVNVNPWWLPFAALPVFAAGLGVAILVRRRVSWRYRPRFPSRLNVGLGYGLSFFGLIAVMVEAVVFGIPGTVIRVSPLTIAYFLPLFAFAAFAGSGRKEADFGRDGLAVSGWLLALILSIVIGWVIAPRLLIPFRHIEYVVLVLAIFGGSGFVQVLRPTGRRVVAAGALAGLLVAGGAATAIPPSTILAGFEEGIRPATLDAAYWAGMHIDGLLATDHRASTIAFGFGGVAATWDAAPLALTASDFGAARAEMCAVNAPTGVSRVDYVLIDADLANGVQLSPLAPSEPLSPAAAAKFADAPYHKVFDSGYAQVYFVNWGLSGGPCP